MKTSTLTNPFDNISGILKVIVLRLKKLSEVPNCKLKKVTSPLTTPLTHNLNFIIQI